MLFIFYCHRCFSDNFKKNFIHFYMEDIKLYNYLMLNTNLGNIISKSLKKVR